MNKKINLTVFEITKIDGYKNPTVMRVKCATVLVFRSFKTDVFGRRILIDLKFFNLTVE